MALSCPHCRQLLLVAERGGNRVCACKHCGGVWIDAAAAHRIATTLDPQLTSLADAASSMAETPTPALGITPRLPGVRATTHAVPRRTGACRSRLLRSAWHLVRSRRAPERRARPRLDARPPSSDGPDASADRRARDERYLARLEKPRDLRGQQRRWRHRWRHRGKRRVGRRRARDRSALLVPLTSAVVPRTSERRECRATDSPHRSPSPAGTRSAT